MSDELFLVARGRRISGWTDVSVTLKADGFPGQFTIALTWRDQVTKGAVIAAAGDPCQVYLGDDLVISGYIDEDVPSGSAHDRHLELTGRGKCQDLADCSAEWDTGQLVGGDALTISRKLAAYYGIEVVLGTGAAAGPLLPFQWALDYTETPAAIIQRLAQNAGLLAYEDAQGRLVLAAAGTTTAASGVVYAENVEAWSIVSSMAARYSDVRCSWLGTATLTDITGSGGDFFHVERDPNVPRHRLLDIVMAEVAEDAKAFTIRKAQWEVARRAGRATVATATVDSWRDAAGTLWTPNTLIPVSLPGDRITDPELILAQVTFRKGSDGTHAELVMMPKQAFAIEPINLLPVNTADLQTVNPQP